MKGIILFVLIVGNAVAMEQGWKEPSDTPQRLLWSQDDFVSIVSAKSSTTDEDQADMQKEEVDDWLGNTREDIVTFFRRNSRAVRLVINNEYDDKENKCNQSIDHFYMNDGDLKLRRYRIGIMNKGGAIGVPWLLKKSEKFLSIFDLSLLRVENNQRSRHVTIQSSNNTVIVRESSNDEIASREILAQEHADSWKIKHQELFWELLLSRGDWIDIKRDYKVSEEQNRDQLVLYRNLKKETEIVKKLLSSESYSEIYNNPWFNCIDQSDKEPIVVRIVKNNDDDICIKNATLTLEQQQIRDWIQHPERISLLRMMLKKNGAWFQIYKQYDNGKTLNYMDYYGNDSDMCTRVIDDQVLNKKNILDTFIATEGCKNIFDHAWLSDGKNHTDQPMIDISRYGEMLLKITNLPFSNHRFYIELNDEHSLDQEEAAVRSESGQKKWVTKKSNAMCNVRLNSETDQAEKEEVKKTRKRRFCPDDEMNIEEIEARYWANDEICEKNDEDYA